MQLRRALIAGLAASGLAACGAATALDVDLRADGGAIDSGVKDAAKDAPVADTGRPDVAPPDSGPCGPLYLCASGCKDLQTDVQNCGGCDLVCKTAHGTPSCVAASCQVKCDPGWGDCNASAQDGCETDLTSNVASCGACGKACGANQKCVSGTCTSSSCGNMVVDANERCDGASCALCNAQVACFAPGNVNECRWDFSKVPQLYCNGTCTWAGGNGCDQADADVFCKLLKGDPNAKALSFQVMTAQAVGGFSCQAIGNYGTPLGPIPEYGVNLATNGGVRYQATSILANHGAGDVIVNPVCQ